MSQKEILDLRAFWKNAIPGDYQHFLSQEGFFVHSREPEAGGTRKILTTKGEILATGRIIRLDWDSEFFGFPSARVEGLFFSRNAEPASTRDSLISTILEDEAAKNAAFLTCRVRADDILLAQALEQGGFRLVDVMAIFMKKLKSETHVPRKGRPLKYEVSNILPLVEKCLGDMDLGRMFADPRIPKEQAQEFYVRLSRYYLDQGAFAVVLKQDRKNAGLAIGILDDTISKYLNRKYGYLWLMALAPEFRGRGLGHKLFALFCEGFSHTCDTLEVGTQAYNYPALGVYQKSACAISSYLLTFHKWNKNYF